MFTLLSLPKCISETAINIGYSCRLLTDEMEEPFIIDGKTEEEVESQMKKALEDIDAGKNSKNRYGPDVAFRNGATKIENTYSAENGDVAVPDDEFGEFALVINGHSLV